MNTASAADRLVERLRAARRILAITGAGVSAESGIPTYRGVAGLYAGDDGAQVMRDLSYGVFLAEPLVTYRRVSELLARCAAAAPNPAHRALARCQAWAEVDILTQNVDGLHQAAGSRRVVEVHGSVFRLACPRCGHRRTLPRAPAPEPVACDCGEWLRHDVVLFGENLPEEPVREMLEMSQVRRYDVALSIGTTAMFPYIQGVGIGARERGASLIELNPEDTELTHACDDVVRAPAGQVLGALLEDAQ